MSKCVLWSALLASLVAASGCGKKGLTTYPVHGSVNVDGKATDGVMVIFCPVGGTPEVQKLRPFGVTESDGKFELTTDKKGDGAPAGEYKVIAQWSAKPSTDNDDRGRSLGADRLQGRYMNLEKSQITLTVKPESNDIAPFELKSR